MPDVPSPRPNGSNGRDDRTPLGIVCGGGAFPAAVAVTVQRSGRPVVLFPFRGFADPVVERYPHEWIYLGAFGRLLSLLRAHGCRDVVFIGTLQRPKLWDLRLDLTTLRLMPRLAPLFRGGDDRLLSGAAALLEEHGFRLVGAHDVAPDLLVPAGVLGRRRPRPEEQADVALGVSALRSLGAYDVGQAAVVAHRRILAIEAAEGTTAMLERVASLRRAGRLALPARAGVLVKMPKPGQDRRIDLPAIGPDTVAQALAAGLIGIAVEAQGTIAADFQRLVQAADAAEIFIAGIEGTGEVAS